MSDTTLREKIVIDGAEAATAKLGMMATMAGRVAGAFGVMGTAIGAFGGIAGMWGIAETIRDVDHLYAAVGRVVDSTGMAADHAHAMFDMFELSGVEMESAERIMMSMTRSAEKMSDGFGGVGAQAQMVNSLMRSIGVSIKAGPEDRLFAMSKAAVDGKLNIDELTRAFMIPRSTAGAVMSMLKSGPDALKAIQKDTLTGADVIDDRALQTYRTMLKARRELKDAWGDLVGIFYKDLLPAVTTILQEIKKWFDKISPVADKIGKFLSTHMHAVVEATRTYVKLLLVAKAINLFAGPENQKGIIGRGKQVFGGAMGLMKGRAAAAGGLDYFAAKAASPGAGMFATAGGPLIRIMGTVAGRLGIIGVVVTLVITAFEMLKNNIWGLRDKFVSAFGGIWSTLQGIFGKLMGIFGKLWEAIKPLAMLFAGALLFQLLLFAKWLGFLVTVIEKVLGALVDMINWVIRHSFLRLITSEIDLSAKNQAEDTAKKNANSNKPGEPPNMDFRGSKFEINNNFPQGIDGGRVAVAFGDELAKLGERRLDSGLRPLYSVR